MIKIYLHINVAHTTNVVSGHDPEPVDVTSDILLLQVISTQPVCLFSRHADWGSDN